MITKGSPAEVCYSCPNLHLGEIGANCKVYRAFSADCDFPVRQARNNAKQITPTPEVRCRICGSLRPVTSYPVEDVERGNTCRTCLRRNK